MTVSSDRHMLSGGVHAPVSVWRGVLQRQFTFSHLGGQKGGKSGCWDMIAALRRRKDRFDAQRVLRETMDQLSCLQIRAHVFVWKWDVWRGLSSILANLEQDDGDPLDDLCTSAAFSLLLGHHTYIIRLFLYDVGQSRCVSVNVAK